MGLVEGLLQEVRKVADVVGSSTSEQLPDPNQFVISRRRILSVGAGATALAIASAASNRLPSGLWLPPSAQAAELDKTQAPANILNEGVASQETLKPAERCVFDLGNREEMIRTLRNRRENINPLAINSLKAEQIIDFAYGTYLDLCAKNPHAAGEPGLKVKDIKKLSVIAVFPDAPTDVKALSADNQFRDAIEICGYTVAEVFRKLLGFNINNQIWTETIRMSEPAGSYRSNDDVMNEIMSLNKFSLDYNKNGMYTVGEMVLLTDYTNAGRLWANGGSWGTGGITAIQSEIILTQDILSRILAVIHEFIHALRIYEHSDDPLSIMAAGMGKSDPRLRHLERRFADRLCIFGQAFVPAAPNGYKP